MPFRVRLRLVSSAENVIGADVVKIRKLDKNVSWYVSAPYFIMRVTYLRALQVFIVIGTALFGKMSIVENYASIILASVILVIIGFYGMYYLKDKRLLSFFLLWVILSPFAGIIAFPIINNKIQTIISAYEMGEGSRTKDLEIQCPKCYEVYDYRINSCPKCGYNLIYRKVTK